jgi:hypothetical protein
LLPVAREENTIDEPSSSLPSSLYVLMLFPWKVRTRYLSVVLNFMVCVIFVMFVAFPSPLPKIARYIEVSGSKLHGLLHICDVRGFLQSIAKDSKITP